MFGRLKEVIMLSCNIPYRHSSLETGKEVEDGPDVFPCV